MWRSNHVALQALERVPRIGTALPMVQHSTSSLP